MWLQSTRDKLLLPQMSAFMGSLAQIVKEHSGDAMLARTHGQIASPTTVGKEFANVLVRLHAVSADIYVHNRNRILYLSCPQLYCMPCSTTISFFFKDKQQRKILSNSLSHLELRRKQQSKN